MKRVAFERKSCKWFACEKGVANSVRGPSVLFWSSHLIASNLPTFFYSCDKSNDCYTTELNDSQKYSTEVISILLLFTIIFLDFQEGVCGFSKKTITFWVQNPFLFLSSLRCRRSFERRIHRNTKWETSVIDNNHEN